MQRLLLDNSSDRSSIHVFPPSSLLDVSKETAKVPVLIRHSPERKRLLERFKVLQTAAVGLSYACNIQINSTTKNSIKTAEETNREQSYSLKQ
jgi:hypothetical protein